ncbi:CRISPR-associated endoribonuclease Cas6 [Sulfoacidibacillus thermotolerans]|uniref:CRISPR-associated endoribonuclease Cas6 n=1 Tax=Sulfoacidibacillus thermotolerans TaxID=1765684 RepID=UPI0015E7F825|nr:CRISPR-associated endoribonuclease Cas6 [Sulfoacidibacillus thermotolerans]
MAHHEELQHAFYSLVDAHLVQAWHEHAEFRPYTFSRLLGKFNVHEKQVTFPYGFRWWMSLHSSSLLTEIYERLLETPTFSLGQQRVVVERVEREFPPLFGERALFRTLSPVVVDNNVGKQILAYSPDQSEFEAQVVANAMKKAEQFLGRTVTKPIRFQAVGTSKRIVSWYKTTPIEGYVGQFVVEAEPEVTRLLYDVGVGRRNGLGFGCLEYIV